MYHAIIRAPVSRYSTTVVEYGCRGKKLERIEKGISDEMLSDREII
jgi:hypothetical protein